MRLDSLVYRAMGLALPHHFTADFYSAPIAHDIERARQQVGYSSRYEIVRLALSVRRVRYCHYQAIPRGRT